MGEAWPPLGIILNFLAKPCPSLVMPGVWPQDVALAIICSNKEAEKNWRSFYESLGHSAELTGKGKLSKALDPKEICEISQKVSSGKERKN